MEATCFYTFTHLGSLVYMYISPLSIKNTYVVIIVEAVGVFEVGFVAGFVAAVVAAVVAVTGGGAVAEQSPIFAICIEGSLHRAWL